MLDFVIAGAEGFIGSYLKQSLSARGFSIACDGEFAAAPQKARFFVNCTNAAGSPAVGAGLVRSMWHLANNHAEVFVQFSSFSTLHGAEKCDPSRVNCGFVPRLLDPYACGKLLQERVLGELSGGAERWFLYLPAVLGSGGVWEKVIETTMTHGVARLDGMHPNARPNFIDVADIADFLVKAAGTPSRPQHPLRVILSNPAAEHLSWQQFFGGTIDPADKSHFVKEVEVPQNAAARAKSLVRDVAMAGFALAESLGMWSALERRKNKVLPELRWQAPRTAPQFPARPFELRGVTQHVVLHQPYIPAESNT